MRYMIIVILDDQTHLKLTCYFETITYNEMNLKAEQFVKTFY